MVVTQAVRQGEDDEPGLENITVQYKGEDGGGEERWAVMNAVRGNERAREIYSYPGTNDVEIDLQDVERVNFGDTYRARVVLKVGLGNNIYIPYSLVKIGPKKIS